jgi:hypothetical protein
MRRETLCAATIMAPSIKKKIKYSITKYTMMLHTGEKQLKELEERKSSDIQKIEKLKSTIQLLKRRIEELDPLNGYER